MAQCFSCGGYTKEPVRGLCSQCFADMKEAEKRTRIDASTMEVAIDERGKRTLRQRSKASSN